jgi:hypothetical protein
MDPADSRVKINGKALAKSQQTENQRASMCWGAGVSFQTIALWQGLT